MWDSMSNTLQDNLHTGYGEAENIDSLLKQRSLMFLCFRQIYSFFPKGQS